MTITQTMTRTMATAQKPTARQFRVFNFRNIDELTFFPMVRGIQSGENCPIFRGSLVRRHVATPANIQGWFRDVPTASVHDR